MVWTADGKEVEWPHSNTPMTTATSDQLIRMRTGPVLQRIMAHGELTAKQVSILYRGSASLLALGSKRRRLAIVIRCLKIEQFAIGVSEENLYVVLSPKNRYNRFKAIEALVRVS